jgi:4-amino-4-deoxy-L-arabinose transferase-like glycosyltransferase
LSRGRHLLPRALPYALLLAVTAGIYLQTLAFDFVWDDGQYIIDNFKIQAAGWESVRRIWTEPHLSNYAPLHLQLLSIVYGFSGLNPLGYHLATLLLHGLCVCLLYGVVARMESPRVALLASLWFAVHAPNVETVAWVAESKSTLAFALLLLSLLCYMRYREQARPLDLALCCVLLTLSLLAKVSAIVAPAVFLAYDLRQGGLPAWRKWPGLIGPVLITAAFVAIHLRISEPMQSGASERLRDAAVLPASAEARNSAAPLDTGLRTRLLNLPGLLIHYARQTLVPAGLSPWRLVRIETAFRARALAQWAAALLLLAALALAPWWARFWGLWFLLFFAPVLQLVPNATWVADRYLYIPAVAVFVLLSKLLLDALDRVPSRAIALGCQGLAALALVALGAQALLYTRSWSDDVTLWRAAAAQAPASGFVHYKLGDAEMEAHTGTPIAHFERAVALRPEKSYQLALARAYTDLASDYNRADAIYQRVQRPGESLPFTAVASIARNHYLAGNDARAGTAVRLGLAASPTYSPLIIVRAFLEWRRGEASAARASLLEALELNRSNPEAQHPPRFLLEFWQRPAELGELLRDVGPL